MYCMLLINLSLGPVNKLQNILQYPSKQRNSWIKFLLWNANHAFIRQDILSIFVLQMWNMSMTTSRIGKHLPGVFKVISSIYLKPGWSLTSFNIAIFSLIAWLN